MNYNFDQIVNREQTDCFKFDMRKEFFGDPNVIPMWVADMDFETPDFIRNAIAERLKHPILGYSIKPDSYFQSIINWIKNRHQWEVKQEEISFSPGVVPGFTFAILAFSNENDQIVVQPPVYHPFFWAINDNKRKLVYNHLKEEGNHYSIDFEDLEEKLSHPKTKLFLISSPHNPVGRVWTADELQKMMDLCIKHQVLLLSDEIHADLVFKPHTHIPTASISDQAKDHCITFMAPSKTFNMAGLSTSYLIIQNPELKTKYEKVLEALHLSFGNLFGNVGLEAAYNEGAEWLEELLIYLQQNIQLVKDFLQKHLPEVTFLEPEATYLLWLNCKSLNLTDKELAHFFIKEARLGLNDGTIFGPGGSGFMRMNVACPTSTVEKALNQLKEAIEKKR